MRNVCKIFAILFFFIVDCQNLTAQLCEGSLGDPIVNITFGSGSNPGPPLSAATTTYGYASYDCPNDGFYAVRNSTSDCFGGTWYTLNQDHTGDPNGYFMLVNASYEPSSFYLDTVKGLCGNTTYEFAAWVANVFSLQSTCGARIDPNITFNIEEKNGAILQSYNSGNIPSQSSPVWQQFGFYFTTPSGVSDVVLRIFNNAPGGCGNDLALDDITFRPCGPKLTLSVAGTNSDSVQLCDGVAKSLDFSCTVSPPGFSNPVFQWQQNINGIWSDIPGASATSYTQNFPATTSVGKYFFRVRATEFGNEDSPQCGIFSLPVLVQVNANPATTAVNNGPVCENTALTLTATGGSKYIWTGVNNFSDSGSSVVINAVMQTQAGKYYVLVSDNNGCINTDSTVVNVKPAPVAATTFSKITICSGKSVQLVSSGGSTYSWSPVAALSSSVIGNPIASPLSSTLYVVTVTNQVACSDTASVMVTVDETPTANAGPDKAIIQGNTVTLSGSATGQSITYSWSPPVYMDNPQILQPVVNPPSDINYVLKVVSSNGCGSAADTMHVFWYKNIYVPSAFTPNGDGLNDTWRIPALSAFSSFDVVVFDRWGKIVFQSKNTSTPWDGTYKGTPAPIGTYVYQISLSQPPGLLKGTVTIVR